MPKKEEMKWNPKATHDLIEELKEVTEIDLQDPIVRRHYERWTKIKEEKLKHKVEK